MSRAQTHSLYFSTLFVISNVWYHFFHLITIWYRIGMTYPTKGPKFICQPIITIIREILWKIIQQNYVKLFLLYNWKHLFSISLFHYFCIILILPLLVTCYPITPLHNFLSTSCCLLSGLSLSLTRLTNDPIFFSL